VDTYPGTPAGSGEGLGVAVSPDGSRMFVTGGGPDGMATFAYATKQAGSG
jgi:DNA-binding beta-propeller fold protein YncE